MDPSEELVTAYLDRIAARIRWRLPKVAADNQLRFFGDQLRGKIDARIAGGQVRWDAAVWELRSAGSDRAVADRFIRAHYKWDKRPAWRVALLPVILILGSVYGSICVFSPGLQSVWSPVFALCLLAITVLVFIDAIRVSRKFLMAPLAYALGLLWVASVIYSLCFSVEGVTAYSRHLREDIFRPEREKGIAALTDEISRVKSVLAGNKTPAAAGFIGIAPRASGEYLLVRSRNSAIPRDLVEVSSEVESLKRWADLGPGYLARLETNLDITKKRLIPRGAILPGPDSIVQLSIETAVMFGGFWSFIGLLNLLVLEVLRAMQELVRNRWELHTARLLKR